MRTPQLLLTAVAASAILTATPLRTMAATSTVAPAAAASAERLVLPPPKAGRARPLVVVVAGSAGAETTDFVIPYGVLKEAGVADVRSLSTAAGPVQLAMALKIRADQTLAAFDAETPAGADIVVIPAQMHPKDPALAAWLRSQADRGAVLVSICEGARVLANAGLLNGRHAATHWHALRDLEKHYPSTTWVRDRRYVQDGPIISTTGVSASIPASLALIEAIGGREVALATAHRLGAEGWSAQHKTAAFSLTAKDYANALGAMGAVWTHETIEAPLADGVDDVGLALAADAWGRTFRSKVVTTGASPVRSRHGLTILPDETTKPGRSRLPLPQGPSLQQLDRTVAEIRRRYGNGSARLVLTGMEYVAVQGAPLSASAR